MGIEEFASPGPAVKLARVLPPCDTVVSAGVDHPSATAWQRVAQHCVESGSGSGDAMPTSIVTPLPRYPQTHEYPGVTADAGGFFCTKAAKGVSRVNDDRFKAKLHWPFDQRCYLPLFWRLHCFPVGVYENMAVVATTPPHH